MRKISWMTLICIAMGIAQPLVAADDAASTARSSNSSTGRSRLLIYSRNKTPTARTPVAGEDQAERPARASLSEVETEVIEDRPARPPVANTGTFSPRSGITSRTTQRPANPVTKPRAATPQAPVQDLAADPTITAEDASIRQMFEEVQPAIPNRRTTARSATTSPATTSRAGTTARLEGESATSSSDALRPVESQARKSARYQDLLESVRPGAEQFETEPVAAKPVTANREEKIQPVAGQPFATHDLDVNPFEISEQSTKVVNAGHKEEPGLETQHRVLPVGATRTTPAPTPTAKGTPAKSLTAKGTDAARPLGKTISINSKPAASQERPVAAVLPAATVGTHQAPQVEVQWEARGEVTLGQQCQCALIVKNNGKVSASDIIVEAIFPESVRLVDAVPFPKSASSKLEWQFETLAPGEQKSIELSMVPTKRGELAASAQVRFTGIAATSFQVSEPLLSTSIKLAKEVYLGEPASATVTVSNPGTGTAQNVVVQATLPAGLDCQSGKNFSTEIGPLGAGETRTVRIGLIATSGGEQTVKVVTKSSTAGLEHSSQAQISVLAPSLTLKATGPSLRYLNRTAKYALTATNTSQTATENVRISQVVSGGFDFVKADHGGRWDAQSRTVSWYVGHLDAGQSTTVELELLPQRTGEFNHLFRVTGDAGAGATAAVATRIEGAASLVMEVKDGEDPIEVGNPLTYEIRVRNDGSKSASKVAVSCELPPDVELIKVDGPTDHLIESGMLIFKPAAELPARETLTFKVTVKGSIAGTMKLRARLTSESIQKPLIVEEATQFYAE